MTFNVGDLVRLPLLDWPTVDLYGVVEAVDAVAVRVRWESGGLGVLYRDGRSRADARRLEIHHQDGSVSVDRLPRRMPDRVTRRRRR